MNNHTEVDSPDRILDVTNEDIKNTVIARLRTIPGDVSISIGNEGSFLVKELIERVERGDEIGRETIRVQVEYLRSLSNLPIERP